MPKNRTIKNLFGDSYLGNRWEMRGKGAHFRKAMSRATTYNKMGEKKILTLDPPSPLKQTDLTHTES